MEQKKFDLIIIGGGAAGMMAAISARRHHPEYNIAILDRTFALGRKILVCGAGRCNITNINLHESIDSHYYGAQDDFIKSIFNQFGFDNIVSFFEDLGVGLYVERKTDIGKMFPVTNQAHTITEMMLDEIERAKIAVFLNTEVTKITAPNLPQENFQLQAWEIERDGKRVQEYSFVSSYLILSAGGKTYPALGSNGSGYSLVEELGHSLVEPVPSALPLEAKNPLSQLLQGQRMETQVTSIINGQEIKTRADDMMFTKYGLSGPVILNVSREISIHVHREQGSAAALKLNFLPGKSKQEVIDELQERWQKRPDQGLEKSLYGLFPNKFAAAILQVSDLPNAKLVSEVTQVELSRLAGNITEYIVKVDGTRGWNEAEFTAGGINNTQVKTTTLESNLVPNLFLAGEILDVDGDVGGFNLSWSWSSGYVAGKLQA